MFWNVPLECGRTVYVIGSTSSVSEWQIAEVISAGHSFLYKLCKDEGNSFCMFESSRLGKDFFTDKKAAIKELERRKNK